MCCRSSNVNMKLAKCEYNAALSIFEKHPLLAEELSQKCFPKSCLLSNTTCEETRSLKNEIFLFLNVLEV